MVFFFPIRTFPFLKRKIEIWERHVPGFSLQAEFWGYFSFLATLKGRKRGKRSGWGNRKKIAKFCLIQLTNGALTLTLLVRSLSQ